jgi:hypothetical protein
MCTSFTAQQAASTNTRFALLQSASDAQKLARSMLLFPEYPPVSPTDLDIWEKEILTEFQEFMRSHPRIRWIHWSMTDDKFGWPLIQRRSAEHQMTDYTEGLIDLNLNHFLEEKYGNNYEKHGHLYNLIRRNRCWRTLEGKIL